MIRVTRSEGGACYACRRGADGENDTVNRTRSSRGPPQLSRIKAFPVHMKAVPVLHPPAAEESFEKPMKRLPPRGSDDLLRSVMR
jgi:hypothetical protein